MSEHARLSPSASKGWIACAGRLALEAAFPNLPNTYSDNGTGCHIVGADCLRFGGEPLDSVGEMVTVSEPDESPRQILFTEALAEMTQGYVDTVRALAKGHELHVEQRVDFSHFVGVPDQFGTADAIILTQVIDNVFELAVIDLKTGYVFVPVEGNTQLMIYALGAYAKFRSTHNIKTVRLMIYQPAHGGMSEWVITIQELLAFAETLHAAAYRAETATKSYPNLSTEEDRANWEKVFLHPSPNAEDCAFCRAMATCPAYTRMVEETVGASFEAIAEEVLPLATTLPDQDDARLSVLMKAADAIEDFIRAVRAEVERRLLLGRRVDGFGLELGREGARKWKDAKAVEAYLRGSLKLRMDLAYDMSLISPTTAEKLATKSKRNPSPPISARQWKKMQAYIGRAAPVPSVKPLNRIKASYQVPGLSGDAFAAVNEDQLW